MKQKDSQLRPKGMALFMQKQIGIERGAMNHSAKKHPWVTVAVFEDLNAGKTLESIFRSKGIKSRTYNDRLLQLFLFLCPPRVTFRAQVRLDDFQKAIDLLDSDPSASSILQQALHCPSCDSLRVSYPQMTRKFFLPTAVLHLGIIFRVLDHEAYCENCHYTWNLGKENCGCSKSACRRVI